MNIQVIIIFLIGGLFFLSVSDLYAQKTRTRLKAYYFKMPNNDRRVSCVLTSGSGRNLAFVENAEILISTFNEEEELELASLITNADGEASLYIESGYPLMMDNEGFYSINAVFVGNDTLRAADRLVKFKDLNIDVSFKTEDSLKQVTVSTYEFDSTGNKVPVSKVDLDIGVERLYSTLFLNEVETNEEGVGIMIFPNDIPGDSIGTINVVVRLDDHDDYGTVNKISQVNWGTMVDYSIKSNGRSLFGDEAPLWMIISVFLILLGAWYHFVRAVVKLYKMKNVSAEQTTFGQVVDQ